MKRLNKVRPFQIALEARVFKLATIDGETTSLNQPFIEGRPVAVYSIASWPTCARNWPPMPEIYPELEDRLKMVALSIVPADTEDVIRKPSN